MSQDTLLLLDALVTVSNEADVNELLERLLVHQDEFDCKLSEITAKSLAFSG